MRERALEWSDDRMRGTSQAHLREAQRRLLELRGGRVRCEGCNGAAVRIVDSHAPRALCATCAGLAVRRSLGGRH
jgi:hypothetical protein